MEITCNRVKTIRTLWQHRLDAGLIWRFPFLGTWKEIRSWSNAGRHSDVMLKRPDGCKLAQKLLDTVWGPDGMNISSGRMMLVCLASGRDDTSSGMMEQWIDGCPDGWQGTWILLTCRFWIVESLFTASLHLSDFVQTQNEAKILTVPIETNELSLWPFWDKNHLTGLEIHSRSKIKITPPFCLKGTKGDKG